MFAFSALVAADETLVMLKNPTNSAPRITSLWGGGGSEQIVMKSDSTVWAWGYNSFGQVGNGTTNESCVPAQVLGPGGVGYLAPVATIMGGEQHNFALKPDGTVWAWGMNFFGQLGDGSTNWGVFGDYSATPVKVTNLTSIVSLGGRGYHSLALKSDGTVWAWGHNLYGQLGIGVTSAGTNVPVQVIGLTNPASIIGAGFSSFALMPDGTVRAWGEGTYGQCGDGAGVNRSLPVQVAGLSNVTAISGGWWNIMALKSDGTVWAWGSNGSGEVGDGTTIQRNVPVQVTTLGTNAVSVWAGDGNSMALLSDGTVWKWGANQYGEQGDGTSDTNAHPVPQKVPSLSNVAVAVCRDYHDICIKRDGTIWVWGDNRWGGCGDLSGNSVLIPRLMPGLVSNNVIPCSDSFESRANGFSMIGTNSWYADTAAMAVVTTNNYTNTYTGTFPIAGPHQMALQINGSATNRFCPSFYTNVWVDVILECKYWTNTVLPTADTVTNSQFALCITTNRHLAVWNCTNAPTRGNGWTELLDTDVGSNQYCRITIKADYSTSAPSYYSVWLNGIASITPKARYTTADASQPWFSDIVGQGRFCVDDLMVGTNKPFSAILASSTGYGTISPTGTVIANIGTINTFTMTASNWYHLASLTVDGGNAGTPGFYTFTNILADHTITANYSADLAANNTPKWWLYQENTNWSTNFDLAALSDQDGDGMFTWQEYIAGTHPTDPASVFSLNIAPGNGEELVILPTVATTAPQEGLNRYYSIESCTNLSIPNLWQPIPGWTNIPGMNQTIIYTNMTGGSNLFFRCRVWLGL